MARAMAQAMAEAHPVTTSEFEIEGSSELTYCPEGCTARFRAQPDQMRVFCGTDAAANTKQLDDYANMIFGTDIQTMPSGIIATPPCAMLEVLALKPREPVQMAVQIST
jgi:hypothetical protein